jgi:hypothetical protein
MEVLMITASFGMQGAAGQPVTTTYDAHLTPRIPEWMSFEDYVGNDSNIDLLFEGMPCTQLDLCL